MGRWGDPAPSPSSSFDSLRMPTAKEIKWVPRLIARMRTRIRRYSREKRFSEEVRNMMHMIQYEADDATRTDLVDRHIQMHALIRSLDSESAGLDRPIGAVKRNVEPLFGEGHLPPDL
ncbi:hypothetical protein TIFTF001_016736 [Ficus carica]|uniref:Uncharacterized protein n=1 Tax=Ficus carica TaxID=3494 RepID=A0AA88D908_FICCA|nr:hypothetical protein TIFTF001_016736 [Ficus carica]